jgi:outer membrane protein TolC
MNRDSSTCACFFLAQYSHPYFSHFYQKVMTLLFQKGTWESKLRRVVELALAHARNLALYAAAYKSTLALLRVGQQATTGTSSSGSGNSGSSSSDSSTAGSSNPLRCSSLSERLGSPAAPWHAAVAGAVGGYFIWGDYSGVNYQITL